MKLRSSIMSSQLEKQLVSISAQLAQKSMNTLFSIFPTDPNENYITQGSPE